jgi:hypothetical protein
MSDEARVALLACVGRDEEGSGERCVCCRDAMIKMKSREMTNASCVVVDDVGDSLFLEVVVDSILNSHLRPRESVPQRDRPSESAPAQIRSPRCVIHGRVRADA